MRRPQYISAWNAFACLCWIRERQITRAASEGNASSSKHALIKIIRLPRSLLFLHVQSDDEELGIQFAPSLLSCPAFKIQGLILDNSDKARLFRDVACALSLKALRCVAYHPFGSLLPEEFATEMLKNNTTLQLHGFDMPGPYGFAHSSNASLPTSP